MRAQERLRAIEEERGRRDRCLLKVYHPGEQQEPVHRSKASELIVRGGKRAGKSVCVSTEFASRVTGQPIIGSTGEEIKVDGPWWKSVAPDVDYPRIYWVIGWDTKHIGQTIYRLLFERGQGGSYRVIEDGGEGSGVWRTWNRANKEDQARVHESKLAEPLIPERMLDGGYEGAFEWEDKKANQFNSCRLTNGSIIYAYPSSSRNPKQGDAVSGIWIDEDIQFPGHLKEWQDRLTDEEGWFMWSVWPHMKNEALLELIDRAEMGRSDDECQIQSFQLIMTDNPFLSEVGKNQSLGRMESEEEVARRNRGELLTDALSMYQFSTIFNQIKRPIEGQVEYVKLSKAHIMLRDMFLGGNGFPRTWTRYLSIDPSNTRTAVHSWVVPPPEYEGVYLGNVAISEWELIARRFSAEMLAKALAERMGTKNYEAFIMDQMSGRQTHAGREENTLQHYSGAFMKHKLISRQTSCSFAPGCNIRSTRFRAVRSLLNPDPPQESGLPSLLFVEETNLETRKEFSKYRKKTEIRGEGVDSVLDEPQSPRLFDAMASVEYFAAYIEPMFVMNQAYVPADVYKTRGSAAYQHAMKILDRRRRTNESDVVYLGAGDYTSASEPSEVSALL